MSVRIITADVMEGLAQLPDESVHCVVTSPPYWGLRDYGVAGQIGLEPTPDAYVAKMVEVFREVRRVLRKDGTCWLNLGDSYAAGKQGRDDEGASDIARRAAMFGTGAPKALAKGANGKARKAPDGFKPKDLIGIPWRVAFALQADGWWLRSDIIWSKPNPMPESVTDRPTKAHEYLFLLTAAERYYYNQGAIREPHGEDSLARVWRGRSDQHKWANGGPGDQTLAKDISKACHPEGRNKRSVWTIATAPFSGSALLADYVGADGRPYRRSEDCPVHGRNGRHQTPQKVGCDEQQGHPESRTPGTDGYPVEARGGERDAIPLMTTDTSRSGSAPERGPQSSPGRKKRSQSQKPLSDDPSDGDGSQFRSGGTQACTMPPDGETGSLPLGYSETATPHSSGSRKTDHVPATDLACIASAQTDNRIVDTSESQAPFDLAERTHESSSALGGSADHPSAQRERGTGRKSSSGQGSTKCTCLPVFTDHFATFPPELPETCIKAGCPAGGTVLDPFAGAGTTLMVAHRLGRDAIGIELNPDYAAMIERRIARDRLERKQGTMADVAAAKLPPTPLEALIIESPAS